VLPLTLDTGEVLPTLVDADSWIPVRVATRWVVRRRRWRSMPSTLANDLRSIGLLYSWASSALEGSGANLVREEIALALPYSMFAIGSSGECRVPQF
jgi:hypothetical protein